MGFTEILFIVGALAGVGAGTVAFQLWNIDTPFQLWTSNTQFAKNSKIILAILVIVTIVSLGAGSYLRSIETKQQIEANE